MSFKKIGLGIILSCGMLFSFSKDNLEILNLVMENGIIVDKEIESGKEDVKVVIFKGLVSEGNSYGLLKVSNNSSELLNIKEILDKGHAIKEILEKGESTYVLIEEETLANNSKPKEDNIEKIVKTWDYEALVKEIKGTYGIYYIENDSFSKIITDNFIEYLSSVKKFDYYDYKYISIQQTLYKGHFFNGYEVLKNGKIDPITYYFIIDNITGKLNYVYFSESKMSYEELKELIKRTTK